MKSYLDNPRSVIILGMHRSGTSMLARMLESCGLFVGAVLEHNHEPPLFRKINDQLLAHAGATWTHPEPFLARVDDREFLQTCRRTAASALTAGFGRHYLGLQGAHVLLGRSIGAWGWKEPRTCVTLPVWDLLYPEARYIHILRHPLDVALSLRARQERKERESADRWSHPECVDMERNLRLWELYVEAARFASSDPLRYLECRYEDLLVSPLESLTEIARFAGLNPDQSALAAAASTTEAARPRHFKDGDPVEHWLNTIRTMPGAQRHGYV